MCACVCLCAHHTSGEVLLVSLSWLQESYALLHKFKIHVAREEMERVDTLRYAWEKLSALAVRSTCKACNNQVQELVYVHTVHDTEKLTFTADDRTENPHIAAQPSAYSHADN